MEITDTATTTRVTHVIQIKDNEKKTQWFIAIEKQNGKFESMREMMNPEYLRKQGIEYMQRVYDLAYNCDTVQVPEKK